MDQEKNVREMGRLSFGFGRWSAPYWFIGPEQAQSPDEHDDLALRAEAWRQLGGGELSDCRAFHANIGENRLHREKPQLQRTWRPLMLLLMTFLGEHTDNDSLRHYQRDKWGTLDGDTCVIELSGMPARSFKVDRDRHRFREDRIKTIRERILQYKPRFVIMYGMSERPDWERIAGQPFPREGVLKIETTVLVLTPHPVSHGSTNQYWMELGRRLRTGDAA